jgi:hypothetical protein
MLYNINLPLAPTANGNFRQQKTELQKHTHSTHEDDIHIEWIPLEDD